MYVVSFNILSLFEIFFNSHSLNLSLKTLCLCLNKIFSSFPTSDSFIYSMQSFLRFPMFSIRTVLYHISFLQLFFVRTSLSWTVCIQYNFNWVLHCISYIQQNNYFHQSDISTLILIWNACFVRIWMESFFNTMGM